MSGGYRQLRSFQVATLIYDGTLFFCERFIDRFSRTCDQMVQAARSGRQNIAEGNRSDRSNNSNILTPDKMFLRWKEDEWDDTLYKLDKYLLKMCRKDRLIELMHDFVLFDGGIKKLPRVHQYFGIKASTNGRKPPSANNGAPCKKSSARAHAWNG